GWQGPLDDKGHKLEGEPPAAWRAAVPSGGAASTKPLLREGGVRGDDGLAHGAQADSVQVSPLPTAAPRATRHWLRAVRQVVATLWAHLSERFGLTSPGAHRTWGLLMRVAA
ncbi:MAG TPA: hypothetical protein VLQ80_23505, partial [Candidatus Saccharimonadia bacterium]|nr:hypothetical protein [Candidatus Saccharimonadia bacterium]